MWQVIGQERIVSLLQHSLEAGTSAHAYLLAGPPHVGKMTLAIDMARALNCEAAERPCGECSSCTRIAAASHADVSIIGLAARNEDAAEAKLISTEQIDDMQHAASLPPFEGRCKVFIIDGADLLSLTAANRLLKTLEEPAAKVVFILLTTNEKLLPATVVSRCQRLELRPLPPEEVAGALEEQGIEPEQAELIAGLSRGCLGWAFTAAGDSGLLQKRDEELDKLLEVLNNGAEERFAYAASLASRFTQNRSAVYKVLELWLDYWRDLLLVKAGCNDIITNKDRSVMLADMARGYRLGAIRDFIGGIQAAAEQLRQNANPKLALEVLMLDIPEKEGGNEVNLETPLTVKHG